MQFSLFPLRRGLRAKPATSRARTIAFACSSSSAHLFPKLGSLRAIYSLRDTKLQLSIRQALPSGGLSREPQNCDLWQREGPSADSGCGWAAIGALYDSVHCRLGCGLSRMAFLELGRDGT